MRKLKEKLNAKLSKNGGFTLVEMLIVVAIIAILVAVSIPLVNGALDKARQATDEANLRAAKAEGAIEYLTVMADTGWNETTDKKYKYYADKGSLMPDDDTTAGAYSYGKLDGHNYVEVTITKDGDVSAAWKK